MPLAPDTGRGALVRRLFLVWVALGLVATLASLELLASQQIRGDDALRLVEVRDLVAGQGWYDLHHYRINPPEGVITHWSRLVDVPIALVLLILTPLLGAHGAEVAAMVVTMPFVPKHANDDEGAALVGDQVGQSFFPRAAEDFEEFSGGVFFVGELQDDGLDGLNERRDVEAQI